MTQLSLANNKTLHITNDEITAKNIRLSQIKGDTLAWQDALYEGPVVDGLSMNKLSALRAEYFSKLEWGNAIELRERFQKRNEKLSSYQSYDEIVLWFDHDLYDQLQLLQIINWFSEQKAGFPPIYLICISRYPGIKIFLGIDTLNTEQLRNLYQQKSELTIAQVTVCQQVWHAFTSQRPIDLLRCCSGDISSMPFLKSAMSRLIQQFPSKINGLSQTELLILQSLRSHFNEPDEMFQFVQAKEPAPFVNRAMFYAYLQNLMTSKVPLLKKEHTEVEEVIDAESAEVCEIESRAIVRFALTDAARQILYNWSDWVQLNGLNRWIGGVHLQEGNIWRFNKETKELKKTYL